MDNIKVQLKHHFIWIILITGLGIFLPFFIEGTIKLVIQFVLTTLFVTLYVIAKVIKEDKTDLIIDEYNKNLEEQKRMFDSQKIMLELSNSMIAVNGFQELMDIILKKVIEVIAKAKFGSILVMNNEGKLEFKAIVGFDKELFDVKLDPLESYQWRATGGKFNGPIIIEDLLNYSENFLEVATYKKMNELDALSLKSSLSAPILINGEYFGSINIDSEKNNMFNEDDKKLMTYFANQATIAIVKQQLYEKLLNLSKYDGLTKVLNRRYFEELFEKLLQNEVLNTTNIAVVLLDLDGFKQINDQFGHSNGDLVLQHFASEFMSFIGPTDLFARYGGDEFVAVLYKFTIEEALEKLEKIHATITKKQVPLNGVDSQVYIDFSYGVSEFPLEADSLKKLLHIADKRMYENKKMRKTK